MSIRRVYLQLSLAQFALLASLGFGVGCGAPVAPAGHVYGCSTTTIGALVGTTPQITWSGNCGIAGVVVESLNSNGSLGPTVWEVRGQPDGAGQMPNNIIQSGVRYGVTPDLATVIVPASPLSRGLRYRVELRVTSIATRVWGATVAQADFTP